MRTYSSLQARRGPSSRTGTCRRPDLGLAASRTVRNKCLLFTSHPVRADKTIALTEVTLVKCVVTAGGEWPIDPSVLASRLQGQRVGSSKGPAPQRAAHSGRALPSHLKLCAGSQPVFFKENCHFCLREEQKQWERSSFSFFGSNECFSLISGSKPLRGRKS